MLNKATSRKFIAPRQQRNKIRNSNIEIRNKPNDINPNYEVQNGLVGNFLIFDHLRLFRSSDFEFRICNFVYAGRALPFDPAQGGELVEPPLRVTRLSSSWKSAAHIIQSAQLLWNSNLKEKIRNQE